MMWRKIINGEAVIAPTVLGPGFSLGPDDTEGVDGWEPVPDDYTEPSGDLAAEVAMLRARLDEVLALIAGD